jgi:hypothetical protein
MNWMWETPALGAALAVFVLAVALRGIFHQRDPGTALGNGAPETLDARPLGNVEVARYAAPGLRQRPARSSQRLVVTVVDDLHREPLWVQKSNLEWTDAGREWFKRLALSTAVDLFFILRVRNDHDSEAWSRSVAALCRTETGGRWDARKFLVCDTAAGAAAMVRQLEPIIHIETWTLASECAARLHRFIPRILLVGGTEGPQRAHDRTILKQFDANSAQPAPFKTAVALVAHPMEIFEHALWRDAGIETKKNC